ncbi:MAG: hypothetical protein JW885_09290 [Deltaproteobacteria bacterium]|nr:hypothetical protein [Candidatus Zymogenaceae bacterium]
MLAKAKFTDGEMRTYSMVKRVACRGEYVIIKRKGGRRVVLPGRELRWLQLGKEHRVYQKDFGKDVSL